MSLLALFKKKETPSPDAVRNMRVLKEFRSSMARLATLQLAITAIPRMPKILEEFFDTYKLPVVGENPDKKKVIADSKNEREGRMKFFDAFYENKKEIEISGAILTDLLKFISDGTGSKPAGFNDRSIAPILQEHYAAFSQKLKHTIQEQQITAANYSLVERKEDFKRDCGVLMRKLDEVLKHVSATVNELVSIEQKL